MPFGRWENFNHCVTDMMGQPNNYDEETARKVCGKLQARLEGKEVFRILKSRSGRRIIAQYVHVEGLDREGDIIPLHRTREALEELKARDPRTHNVMWRHTSYQIGWPLWTYQDEDGNIHKTEVDEYGLWGITEIRNDGYHKAEEIWNKILRGEPMGASIAVKPFGNPIILTKEEVEKRGLKKEWIGKRYWDVPMQFIEPWSLTQNPANQYVTAAQILAKDLCEPCIKARAKWYLKKGICLTMEEALARAKHFYMKYTEHELAKQNEKPPKDWWEACIAHVTGTDKAAVCGHIFHHVLGGDRSRADPNMFKDGTLAKMLAKMTWEECIEQARKNPNVTDPERLCAWLRWYGPHGEKKEFKHPLTLEEYELHILLKEAFAKYKA